jgi:NodT family efflux transporter outer membrane factor (OMF) lipoprotein
LDRVDRAEPSQARTAPAGRRARAGLAAALSAALSGCLVGPNFEPPCPPPIQPVYQNLEGVAVAPIDLAVWWAYFQDPALDQLVAQAVANNLDLREAYFRVLEARAHVGFVRGGLFPQVYGAGSYYRRQLSNNANPYLAPNNQLNPYDLFGTGFDSSWEIDVFGKLRRALEAAEANLAARDEDRLNVLVTLLADVTANYVDYRTLQARRAIAQSNLESQRNTLNHVRQRWAAGLTDRLDVAQAETNVYSTAAIIPQLEQQLREALNRMSVLLGEGPNLELRARLGTAGIPVPPPFLAVDLPADLLRRRPDIRSAEMEVAQRSARIGVATADLYPQFTLLGTLSVDSTNFAQWFSGNSLAYNVGPSVRWHLLSFGKVRSNIAAHQAKHGEAVVHYQSTVLSAVEEVENGLAAWHGQHERAVEFERAVSAATLAAQLAEENYFRGLTDFETLLDSQRQALRLEEDLAITRGAIALAMIRTYKALGGGWEPATGAVPSEGSLPAGNVEPVGPPSEVETLPAPAGDPVGPALPQGAPPVLSEYDPRDVAPPEGARPTDPPTGDE